MRQSDRSSKDTEVATSLIRNGHLAQRPWVGGRPPRQPRTLPGPKCSAPPPRLRGKYTELRAGPTGHGEGEWERTGRQWERTGPCPRFSGHVARGCPLMSPV
ncbi:unnamed protein product [Gadus morhua 'NCC']